MQYIGIDISKRVFDVAKWAGQHASLHQFPNNPAGFKPLLATLDTDKKRNTVLS